MLMRLFRNPGSFGEGFEVGVDSGDALRYCCMRGHAVGEEVFDAFGECCVE